MADQGHYGNLIEKVTVRNNVFTANNHAGLIVQGSVRGIRIYNNTFYQNGRQGIQIVNDPAVDGVEIRNNLIYQSPNSTCASNCGWFPESHIQVGAAARNILVSNNSYHPGSVLVLGGADAGPVTGAVRFVNAAEGDFHLLAGSSVIDRGWKLDDVAADFDGLDRPQGVHRFSEAS
jgi:parallel beta-helix repeat protein